MKTVLRVKNLVLFSIARFANNALLGGGVRVRVGIREQRKIKRRSKAIRNPGHHSNTAAPSGVI